MTPICPFHLLPFWLRRVSNTPGRLKLDLKAIEYGRNNLWRQGLIWRKSYSNPSCLHPPSSLFSWNQRTCFTEAGGDYTRKPAPEHSVIFPAEPKTQRTYHVHASQWWELPLNTEKASEKAASAHCMAHNAKHNSRRKGMPPWDSAASWGYLAFCWQISFIYKIL